MDKSDLDQIVIPRVFKHAGANYAMKNRIREYYDRGESVADCAILLNLEPKCVQSFYNSYEPVKQDEADEPETAPAAAPAPRRKKAGTKTAAAG